ncbi:MAG: lipopolysaccharide heptosyltransferase II [Candidatus Latescibacteria bacterium]|nr:lipopolysaccharide heptosyltransferase II [Candidatus Latescibacterota bacterium]
MPSSGQRPLLLRLPNWLGDLVQALPVVESAAAEASSRGVLFLGPSSLAPLLTPRFPSITYLHWSRARRFASLGEIRRLKPGAALLLTDSLSSALLAALAGIPERIGYDAELRGGLLTRRVKRSFPARSAPRAEEYAVLARAAGLRVDGAVPRIAALPWEREAAESLLRRVGIEGEPYAVLAPGASYGPAKRWDPARFAEVAAYLDARHSLASVLVGTREDVGPAQAVEWIAGECVVNLVGATDLKALVGVLASAEIVISNDSGAMHLAAALGTPTVGLFGSTSPVWTSATAPWVRSLYAAYPCSPCFRRSCPIGYGCLKALEPVPAIRAAAELLERSAAPVHERD